MGNGRRPQERSAVAGDFLREQVRPSAGSPLCFRNELRRSPRFSIGRLGLHALVLGVVALLQPLELIASGFECSGRGRSAAGRIGWPGLARPACRPAASPGFAGAGAWPTNVVPRWKAYWFVALAGHGRDLAEHALGHEHAAQVGLAREERRVARSRSPSPGPWARTPWCAASRTVTRTRPLSASSSTSSSSGVTRTMPEAYRSSPRTITR